MTVARAVLLVALMAALLVLGEVGPDAVFRDRAAEAGVRVRVISGEPARKPYLMESVGGGIAAIDYDNDGWMDLYVVNGTTIAAARAGRITTRSALYRNNGDGTFRDVTAKAGVGNVGWGKGALAADLDGDGWQDLYVSNFGANVLYRNNGDGTFTNVTARAGVGDRRWSSGAAAADYDGDGDLDLFVTNYVAYDLVKLPLPGKFCSFLGLSVACGPRGLEGSGDVLYRNNGNGTFTDVSKAAGVADDEGRYGLGAVWGDYDGDGKPDLFVANDSTPNYLYRNKGDGTFVDRGIEAGVAFSEDGREQAGMGVDLEDMDNDGRLDLAVTNFSGDYNSLRRNNGDGTFRDVSHVSGLAADSWPDLSWGVGLVDINNDGWKDLTIASGHIYPEVDGLGTNVKYRQSVKTYMNGMGAKLRAVTVATGKTFRGTAFADFNNDGWMDVAVAAIDDAPALLMNTPRAGAHWALIVLEGRKPNSFGVGARVTVKAGGLTQVREVKAGGGFASSNDTRQHFGLGSAAVIEELVVAWPSGKSTKLTGVAADRVIRVREGS